jgi:hypothetical protein
VQNKFCTRHVPWALRTGIDNLQFCLNFNHLEAV